MPCCKQEAELGVGASFAGDREILDEVITRSRGEFRHTSSPKITSSTSTPANAPKIIESPRPSYSPRVSEIKGEPSPRSDSGGRGAHSPRGGEVRLSSLGKSPLNTTAK